MRALSAAISAQTEQLRPKRASPTGEITVLAWAKPPVNLGHLSRLEGSRRSRLLRAWGASLSNSSHPQTVGSRKELAQPWGSQAPDGLAVDDVWEEDSTGPRLKGRAGGVAGGGIRWRARPPALLDLSTPGFFSCEFVPDIARYLRTFQ
jgi:hypothetical protein